MKVLKAASEEESVMAWSNISDLSNWENKGSTQCCKGYRRRDRYQNGG